MPDTPQSFAARLKLLRIKNGESLQKAADAVGISKPHFWELEKGESRNPSKELLERIAAHYKQTLAYLLGEQNEAEGELGALFRNLKDLPEPQRAHVAALIESLKKSKSSGAS